MNLDKMPIVLVDRTRRRNPPVELAPPSSPKKHYEDLVDPSTLKCGNPYDFTTNPKDHTFERVLGIYGFTSIDEFKAKHRVFLGPDPTPDKMRLLLRVLRTELRTAKEKREREEHEQRTEEIASRRPHAHDSDDEDENGEDWFSRKYAREIAIQRATHEPTCPLYKGNPQKPTAN